MSFWTRAVSLFVSCLIIMYIVKTIRTKRMREEYIVLWLLTAIGTAILVIFDNLTVLVSRLIGAESDVVMIVFLAFSYVLALLVHYSLRISELMYSTRKLNQEIAILKNEIRELKNQSKKNDFK